jgi:hypothetical protein
MTTLNKQMLQMVNPGGRLRAGCYAVRFCPGSPYVDEPHVTCYEGTIRVEHRNTQGQSVPVEGPPEHGAFVRISGDLYAHKSPWDEAPPIEIPVFPRDQYRFYLCAMGIDAVKADRFELRLQSHSFKDGRWKTEGEFTAAMEWTNAPPDYLSEFDYLKGEVRDSNGRVGTLTMAWVSAYFRRAVVEIDTVEGVPPPTHATLDTTKSKSKSKLKFKSKLKLQSKSKIQVTWESVFKQVGWEVNYDLSDQKIEEPLGVEWSETELFKAAMTLRDSLVLDREWRYYILCVRLLEGRGRGFMFDRQGTDADSFFETVVIGAGYQFHAEYNVQHWGGLDGLTLSSTPGYFRSAVHEIGHAMNLEHNFSDNGFMNTTDTIAARGAENKKGRGFPDNIAWHFASEDQERLRHWPDIVVRPGSPIHARNLPELAAPIYPDATVETHSTSNSHNFELTISPLVEQVPIGAPVRIKLRLANQNSEARPAPRLELKTGHLWGHVIDPDGTSRDFWPVTHPEDVMKLSMLEANKADNGSITLLRGSGGPLFPTPGEHRVVVDLFWRDKGKNVALRAETKVTVTPPRDQSHYLAAQRLLQSRDSLINLAITGDYVGEDNQAINAAFYNEVLGPHLAIIRLKYLLRGRFRGGAKTVFEILSREPNRDLFLGESEIHSLWQLIWPSDKNGQLSGRPQPSKARQQLSGVPQSNRLQPEQLKHVAELFLATHKAKEKIQRVVELFERAGVKPTEISSLAKAIEGAVPTKQKRDKLSRLFHEAGIRKKATSDLWYACEQEGFSGSQIDFLKHLKGLIKPSNGGNGGRHMATKANRSSQSTLKPRGSRPEKKK